MNGLVSAGGVNWGDVPTWLAAAGTIGAVMVALGISVRDAHRRREEERRRQASLVTAWLDPARASQKGPVENWSMGLVIQNNSNESIYQTIAALIGVQGAYRRTAVGGPPHKFEATLGQVPPGRMETSIRFAGYGGLVRFGVELAFQDAAGRYWLRRANGGLEETDTAPPELFKIEHPIAWQSG